MVCSTNPSCINIRMPDVRDPNRCTTSLRLQQQTPPPAPGPVIDCQQLELTHSNVSRRCCGAGGRRVCVCVCAEWDVFPPDTHTHTHRLPLSPSTATATTACGPRGRNKHAGQRQWQCQLFSHKKLVCKPKPSSIKKPSNVLS